MSFQYESVLVSKVEAADCDDLNPIGDTTQNNYAELQPANSTAMCKNSRLFLNGKVSVSDDQWTIRNPKEWTQEDVSSWLVDIGMENNFYEEGHNYAAFSTEIAKLDGASLAGMNEDDFLQFQPEVGSKLFRMFQEELRKHADPNDGLTDPVYTYGAIDDISETDLGYSSDERSPSPTTYKSEMEWMPTMTPILPPIGYFYNPLNRPMIPEPTSPPYPPGLIQKPDGDAVVPISPPSSPEAKPVPRQQRNRPRMTRKRADVKQLHLWEFMLECLRETGTNPNIVRWEDQQTGIFRVVDSRALAAKWGDMKEREREMTYEKMSRALRFARKAGYFEKLDKSMRYPKKLIFKFGSKVDFRN